MGIQVLTEKVARGQYTFLSPWWDDISKPAQDLVSHLLTVDPAKRYTIKEFLEHPWIKNTREPTYAAHDAPPLATPAFERQKQLGINPALLESPGAGKRMDTINLVPIQNINKFQYKNINNSTYIYRHIL